MRALLVGGLFLVLVLAGCVESGPSLQPEAKTSTDAVPRIDPLAPGPYAVAWDDYDAGWVTVGGPNETHEEYEYEASLRGRAWWPEAAGMYPVLLFLHGQHQTCGFAGEDLVVVIVDDCDDDQGFNTRYPNHLGYEYLAERVAAHGYVVLSMLGYELNRESNGPSDVGMWPRGEAVLATLDAIRDLSTGLPAEVTARADLARIGLMGHSRGGEGVVTAVHVNLVREEADRHSLRAVVALAPTDFNARGVPDVALLSLVPYCDGDVSTLHGLRTYDHSRLLDSTTAKVQVLVRGTNHNFYNTRWYDENPTPLKPGDDALFSLSVTCTAPRGAAGWRWTPEETHREALVHVAGFLRWQAGDEVGLAPWFTGAETLPDGACPVACADSVVVTGMLPDRRMLLVANATPEESAAVPAVLTLDGFQEVAVCAGSDCRGDMRSSAKALDLSWRGKAQIHLDFEAEDWSGRDALLFRAATAGFEGDPREAAVDMDVRVDYVNGATFAARAGDYSSALDRQPEPSVSKLALQAVRIPLTPNPGPVASITLSLQSIEPARVWLTDVYVQAEPEVVTP